MSATAFEKLLMTSGPSKPGMCLPEKPPPAPIGSIANPRDVNASQFAGTMSIVCRVLSFFAGGLKPGPEVPGQACPGELLNSALKDKLKAELSADSWFVMRITGKSSEGIEYQRSIFHWNGNRIDQMYDTKNGKFYDFDEQGNASESLAI